MVITGSAIFIEAGTEGEVIEKLKHYSGVTYHVKSGSGTELVVNLEAQDLQALEDLTLRLKEEIGPIVDIAHVYVNFEDEVEKTQERKPH